MPAITIRKTMNLYQAMMKTYSDFIGFISFVVNPILGIVQKVFEFNANSILINSNILISLSKTYSSLRVVMVLILSPSNSSLSRGVAPFGRSSCFIFSKNLLVHQLIFYLSYLSMPFPFLQKIIPAAQGAWYCQAFPSYAMLSFLLAA